MSLEKLFESLDEKVFTAELKESLGTQFDEAVGAKATSLMESRIDEEIDSLGAKSEEHIDFLSEKAEEYVKIKQEEMLESLDKYLERIVEEFVSEAKESLDKSIESEKADMVIEAFDSMLVATGVKIASIVEAKDESSVEQSLEESVDKYDVLVEENIALKEENDTLIKMGVISELKEGLSLVEAEKFGKLAGLVEFSKSEEYSKKLETIKESVRGSQDQNKEKLAGYAPAEKPVWNHLV